MNKSKNLKNKIIVTNVIRYIKIITEHAWILCAVARLVKERTYCLQISFMVRYTTSNPSLSNV